MTVSLSLCKNMPKSTLIVRLYSGKIAHLEKALSLKMNNDQIAGVSANKAKHANV